MMRDDQLPDARAELCAMIEKNRAIRCEEVLEYIKKDPRMLAAAIDDTDLTQNYFVPLNYAVYHDNLGATEAILKSLDVKDNAKAIRSYVDQQLADFGTADKLDRELLFEISYPLNDLVYSSSKTPGGKWRYLPQVFAKSPDMVKLLHRHGYDLNARDKTYPTKDLPLALVDRQINNNPNDPISVPLLRTTLDLAIDQDKKCYEENSCGKFICNFVNYLFVHVTKHRNTEAWENVRDGIFQHWARAGLDFREFKDMNFYSYKGCSCGSEAHQFEGVRDHLFTFCSDMVSRYKTEPKALNRGEYALAACAGGFFPKLLGDCVEMDKKNGAGKEVPQLISHLDDHWKGEYRQMIREASASSVRTAAPMAEVRESALQQYTHGITFSPGRA